ncbi:MAG: GntR family transcriptional regulator YhfZ [Bacillota bacterium]
MRTFAPAMTKTGSLTIQIAWDLLFRQEGSQVARVSDYVERFRTGRGTVQAALRYLEECGAIRLEPRGHKGTYLTFHDRERLWEVIGSGPVLGSMPLPYTRRYEGLATGLYDGFAALRIPFIVAYMRGGWSRYEALQLGKFDFAVMSRFAAETLVQGGAEVEMPITLGEGTHLAGHVAYVRDSSIKTLSDGMRVGIDRESIDQAELTRMEFEDKEITLVEITYNQLLEKLSAEEIDVAIWSIDEAVGRRLGIPYLPLSSAQAQIAVKKATEAVFVVRKGDKNILEILDHLDVDSVVRTQQEVLENKRPAKY